MHAAWPPISTAAVSRQLPSGTASPPMTGAPVPGLPAAIPAPARLTPTATQAVMRMAATVPCCGSHAR